MIELKIDLFGNDLNTALEPGVYQIEIRTKSRQKILYIGESVYPLVRCSHHLYKLKNNPSYWGFTADTIGNSSISLIFSVIENEIDMQKRKSKEKQLIKERTPLSQSGASDWLSALRTDIVSIWLQSNKKE